jgi:phospholipid/cholesterol/gamma-HCH transport system substrate-binding protein
MSKFTLEAKLGIFVLACIAVVAYTMIKVVDLGVKGGFPLKARFQSVEGLHSDAQVQIAGIKVGKVKQIRLEPDTGMALVILDIKDAYLNSIPEDSRILLRTKGLLGDKYVAIEPGKPNARKLQPGDEFTLVYEPTDTDKIIETLGVVANDFQQLIRTAREQIVDKKGAQKVDNFIRNSEQISKTVRELFDKKKEKIGRTIDKLDTTSKNIDEIIALNKKKINRAVDNLESVSRDIRDGRGTLGKLVEDEQLYREANRLVRDLRHLSARIQYGSGSVSRLINDPEMYYEARRAIRNMNKTAEDVSEATPISTLAIILGSVFR